MLMNPNIKKRVLDSTSGKTIAMKSYLDCVLAEPEEGCQRRIKTYKQWFLRYLLLSSFRIFINVFVFLYVKANP